MESFTPDSAPSVTALSQNSSTDLESVARALFRTPENEKWTSGGSYSPSVLSDSDSDSDSEEERSAFASGDTVTSLDLAVDIPTLLKKQKKPPSIWKALREQNGSDSKVSGSKSLDEFERSQPKPRPSSAPGGYLNVAPSQLTNAFSALDRKMDPFWSSRVFHSDTPSGEDEALAEDGFFTPSDFTPPPALSANVQPGGDWRHKAESLQRERNTLKEIIRVDSYNILNLKRALENFDRQSKQKNNETEALNAELQSSKQRVEFLEARDKEHNKTIKVLRDEVGRLAELVAEEIETHKADSAEQLRFENELFASQIIQSEAEMSNMLAMLEQKQVSNDNLRRTIDEMEAKVGMLQLVQSNESEPVQRRLDMLLKSPPSIEQDLIDQVGCLSSKLSEIESEKRAMKMHFEEEVRQKEQEMREVEEMIDRAKQNHEEQIRLSDARQEREVAMISNISTIDQELEFLTQTLLEKDEEIFALKRRIQKGATTASKKQPPPPPSSIFCDLSQCLFS